MPRRPAAFFCLLLTAYAQDAPHLVFSHTIGSDWGPDQDGWMNFVALSSDGRALAANGNVPGAKGPAIGLWTFPEGNFLRGVSGNALAISPDFRYLATDLGVRELASARLFAAPPLKTDAWINAAFSPAGDYVALVRDRQPRIVVRKTADGAPVAEFGARYAASVAFSPDGQTLATGHWNNVTLWDFRTGARLALLMSPSRPPDPNGYQRDGRYLYGLAFSPDGKLLAAGSDDGELQIWDVAARKLVHAVKIGWSEVSNPTFSPDGSLVAAGTYGDGTLRLVDVVSGKILAQTQVSMFGCGGVTFSPDGGLLLTPSNSGVLNNGKHTGGGSVRVFRLVR